MVISSSNKADSPYTNEPETCRLIWAGLTTYPGSVAATIRWILILLPSLTDISQAAAT